MSTYVVHNIRTININRIIREYIDVELKFETVKTNAVDLKLVV